MDFRVERSRVFPLRLLLAMGLVLVMVFLFQVPLSSGIQLEQEWSRTFGGHYGDGAWSLQETDDGGYILAGYTSSRGEGSDLWLVKTDAAGNEIWDRTFGGSGEDVGTSVAATRDGGYVVTGSTKSYGMGEERLWLLKTDSNGSLQWDKTFGGFVSSSGDGGWSVWETKDGGYIVTGYTKSSGAGGKDLWLIKTDSDGNWVWDKTYGGPKDDVGMSVIRSGDGYVVAGRTASFGSGEDDIWLLRVGSDGRELWNTTFGDKLDDAAFQVVALRDGYAIVGRTDSESGKRALLIKTDLFGRKLWERFYEEGSTGISIQQTSDGGFIIGGHIDPKGSGRDALLIKTDPGGDEAWALRLGGPSDDTGTAVVESKDGGCVLAGITSSSGAGAEDAWLVKLRAIDDGKDVALDPQNATESRNESGINAAVEKARNDSADHIDGRDAVLALNSTQLGALSEFPEGSGAVPSRKGNYPQRMKDIENIFKQRRQTAI